MRKTKFQRVASLLLALLILTCGGTIAVGAEETGAVKNESVTDKTIADYKEELESISYAEYEKNFGAVKDATETIVIDPVASLDKDKTTIGELTAEQWAQLQADPTLAGQMVGYYTDAEFDGKTYKNSMPCKFSVQVNGTEENATFTTELVAQFLKTVCKFTAE